MPKYITLDTASDGNVHINVDQILYAETASSTAGDIWSTLMCTLPWTDFRVW